MSDIIKTLRDGVDRTAFEAKKLLRLQTEQGQLNRLQDNRQTQILALGTEVWNLFLAGQISEPSLQNICERIQTIEQQIAAAEQQIDTIKHEQPPAPPKCVQCSLVMSNRDAFCPNCGTPANSRQAALTSSVEPISTCPQCNSTIRTGATFCGSCGTKI